VLSTLAIIPCTSQKAEEPGPAKEVWVGHHFQATLMHVEEFFDEVRIMSFKYGMIPPDFIIEPYDVNIHFEPWEVRVRWKRLILRHVQELMDELKPGIVGLYVGKADAPWLAKKLTQANPDVVIITPWAGKGIGERIEQAYEGISPFIVDGEDIRAEDSDQSETQHGDGTPTEPST
jgi:hypothetical protein